MQANSFWISETWDETLYDEYYNTLQAKRENTELKKLLHRFFRHSCAVVDLGCGTGLGQDLLPNDPSYIGVDINPKMIERCRERRHGLFLNLDAESAILAFSGKPMMALFSLTHFSLRSARLLARQPKVFVVAYDKPWGCASASAYRKMKWRFLLQYGLKTLMLKLLLKRAGFSLFNLLDEPYYFVAVKNRQEGDQRCANSKAA